MREFLKDYASPISVSLMLTLTGNLIAVICYVGTYLESHYPDMTTLGKFAFGNLAVVVVVVGMISFMKVSDVLFERLSGVSLR